MIKKILKMPIWTAIIAILLNAIINVITNGVFSNGIEIALASIVSGLYTNTFNEILPKSFKIKYVSTCAVLTFILAALIIMITPQYKEMLESIWPLFIFILLPLALTYYGFIYWFLGFISRKSIKKRIEKN